MGISFRFKAFGYLLSVHVLALLVMTLFRLVEFIALHGMIVDAEASRVMAFVKGVWFDNVIACYISVLPVAVLLIAASLGWCHRRLLRGINIWYAAWFAIAFMPSAANTPYFQYFFKNINSSIFGWFGYVATTSGMLLQESSYWLYIALYFVFTGSFIYALVRLRRYFEGLFLLPKDNMHLVQVVSRFLISAVMIGACLFGIRGRMGYNPIKVSQAYYCEDSFLNQLGINPAFNLLTSALDDMRKENKELHLMPYAEAITNTRQWLGITGKVDSTNILKREVVNDSLMMKMGQSPAKKNHPNVEAITNTRQWLGITGKVDSTNILKREVVNDSLMMKMGQSPAKKNHPNVVVILMESMSANLLGTFGNQQPLTPTLDSLYQHSLAFTHFYSSGIHTNHGMTATLYSFPALMFRNLMKGTVTPRRKGIATVLKKYGYENMFFMTHEAQYDNMKAFFQTNGYDDIFSQENYPKSEVVNSFGVSDHFEMDYALNTINQKAKMGKPFMATILTVSNHPPYIIPDFFKPKTKEKETQIVEYADWAIGDFLKKASREPWYKNTIFVIQADHGKLVGKSEGELPQSYNHIPLIIFGPGVPQQQYAGLGMQVDVMPTLFGLMNLNYEYEGFGVDYNHIPLIIFGPGVPQQQYAGLGMQVDVMPTLFGLMNLNYEYEGFGVDLLKQQRPMVFYSADNQIVARDHQRCFVYNPSMNRSFCYDVLPNGNLKETKQESKFQDLKNYVFSNIQAAEYIERHQQ